MFELPQRIEGRALLCPRAQRTSHRKTRLQLSGVSPLGIMRIVGDVLLCFAQVAVKRDNDIGAFGATSRFPNCEPKQTEGENSVVL
jgi:hypothetical protein